MINLPDIKPQPLGCEVYKGMTLKEVRESLLRFLVEGLDGDIAKDTKELFSNAELFVFGAVLVVYWTTHITDEYEFKNGAWFLIGSNSPEYKKPIEIFMETQNEPNKDMFPSTCSPTPPQKDAPFYQGMTMEETRESAYNFMTNEGDGDRARNKNAHTLKDPSKTEFYCFGHVVVVERGFRKTTELVRTKGHWEIVGFDTPYYKELIQESQTEKKELEDDSPEKFGEIGDTVPLPNDDSVTPKERQDFVEHEEQKHLMEKEAQRKKEEAEMKTKSQFKVIDFTEYWKKMILAQHGLSDVLTAQDLIQAAKDELVTKIYNHDCSSRDSKQGFAECIKFMEQILKDQPNVK